MTVQANIGKFDAFVRWLLAAGFAALSVLTRETALLSLTLAVFALVIAATALTRTCPIYMLLGVRVGYGASRRGRHHKAPDVRAKAKRSP